MEKAINIEIVKIKRSRIKVKTFGEIIFKLCPEKVSKLLYIHLL